VKEQKEEEKFPINIIQQEESKEEDETPLCKITGTY